MGGRSTSRNQTSNVTNTTTTNTNSTVGVSGDQNAGIVSGVNNSTISMVSTDHGAVRAGADLASKALDNNRLVMDDAMSSLSRGFGDMTKSNERVTTDALAKNEEITKSALKYGESSQKSAFAFGEKALASHENVQKMAFDFSGKVSDKALDSLRANNEDSLRAVSQIAANSSQTARSALAMANETASREQTGSSADMAKVMMAVVAALAVIFVAMAIMKRGR